MKNYFKRFKSFPVHEWVTCSFRFLALVLGLYFSISFSVKRGQGFTLFGDSNRQDNVLEVKGPTSSDLLVLSLFWILTILVLLLFVYTFFFKKKEEIKRNSKDIVDGKTVVLKEKKENDRK